MVAQHSIFGLIRNLRKTMGLAFWQTITNVIILHDPCHQIAWSKVVRRNLAAPVSGILYQRKTPPNRTTSAALLLFASSAPSNLCHICSAAFSFSELFEGVYSKPHGHFWIPGVARTGGKQVATAPRARPVVTLHHLRTPQSGGSDWAGDAQSRKSSSSGVLIHGQHTVAFGR